MLQQAIIVTKDNASALAAELMGSYTAEDILDEANRYFERFTVVLVVDTYRGGLLLSHIVTEPMFKANAKTDSPLNDQYFIPVTQL